LELSQMQSRTGWEWDRTVNLVTNPLVIGSIAKVFAISIGIFWLLLEIMSWFIARTSMTLYAIQHPDKAFKGAEPAFYFIAFLVIISIISIAIVFRNGYDAHFGVNDDGVWMSPQPGQRKTNDSIHRLVFGMGVLTGKPGAMGAAMIAKYTQDKSVSWTEVKRIEAIPSRNAIGFHDSWHCALIIYCLPENYKAILQYAYSKVNES